MLNSLCGRVGAAFRWALIGAFAMVAVGCATSNPPAPAAAASPDYNYIIGPGDTVNIVVWRNPELSMSVPVRPDGKIAAPLVEDLVAMGKDSTTLARDIEKELGKFIRDPVVTVVVTAFVGPYSEQIRVVGEASDAAVQAEDDTARCDDRRGRGNGLRRRERNDAVADDRGRQAIRRARQRSDQAWRCFGERRDETG